MLKVNHENNNKKKRVMTRPNLESKNNNNNNNNNKIREREREKVSSICRNLVRIDKKTLKRIHKQQNQTTMRKSNRKGKKNELGE